MLDSHQYDDILNAPRHVSTRHAPMTPLARAAIFAPYAALTGFESQIDAARHHRCNRILLSEERQQKIGAALRSLKKNDMVSVTYFLYDPGTDGQGGMAEGEYQDIAGKVLQLLPEEQTIRVGTPNHWTDIEFDNIFDLYKIEQ